MALALIGNLIGYYRVLYDTHLTTLIQEQLTRNFSAIRPLSRSQLLDDYFNLAFMGHVSLKTALELTKYLDRETHFTVWEVVFTQLRTSYNFAGPEEFNALRVSCYFINLTIKYPTNQLIPRLIWVQKYPKPSRTSVWNRPKVISALRGSYARNLSIGPVAWNKAIVYIMPTNSMKLGRWRICELVNLSELSKCCKNYYF